VIISFQIGKNIVDDLLKNKSYVTTQGSTYEESDIDMTKILEAYLYIKREYYDTDIVKEDELIESAIKGMTDGL
jgi:hypothetical protein